jgi:hypothetical protein
MFVSRFGDDTADKSFAELYALRPEAPQGDKSEASLAF